MKKCRIFLPVIKACKEMLFEENRFTSRSNKSFVMICWQREKSSLTSICQQMIPYLESDQLLAPAKEAIFSPVSVCLFACLLAGLCKKLCMQFCGLISIGPERPILSVDFGGDSNLDVMMSYLGVFVTRRRFPISGCSC